MATRAERGSATLSPLRRVALAVGFVCALAATVIIFATPEAHYLRMGIVIALWGFVFAALAAGRRQAEDSMTASNEVELRKGYELELGREVTARREYELRLESQLRREMQDTFTTQISGLRDEMIRLREELSEHWDSELRVERMVMRTQSVRMGERRAGLERGPGEPAAIDAGSADGRRYGDLSEAEASSAVSDQSAQSAQPWQGDLSEPLTHSWHEQLSEPVTQSWNGSAAEPEPAAPSWNGGGLEPEPQTWKGGQSETESWHAASPYPEPWNRATSEPLSTNGNRNGNGAKRSWSDDRYADPLPDEPPATRRARDPWMDELHYDAEPFRAEPFTLDAPSYSVAPVVPTAPVPTLPGSYAAAPSPPERYEQHTFAPTDDRGHLSPGGGSADNRSHDERGTGERGYGGPSDRGFSDRGYDDRGHVAAAPQDEILARVLAEAAAEQRNRRSRHRYSEDEGDTGGMHY